MSNIDRFFGETAAMRDIRAAWEAKGARAAAAE
jgi:hypothetical protein